jgi:hypothetical protein
VTDGVVSLSWAAVPGARTYTVKALNTANDEPNTLATGLVSTEFTGITPYEGTSTYVVTAQNSNGESVPSKPVTVDLQHAAAVQRSHVMMH